MTRSRLYFPHINLLRAFAAFSVLVYHVKEMLPWRDMPIEPSLLLWFHAGWMGVDLFFVISGFVIMLSALQLHERCHSLSEARGLFAQRRAFRIMPLYFFSSLLILLFVAHDVWGGADTGFKILTHFAFVQNWWVTSHGAINGASWSVATEMQFYLVILVLMPWLRQVRLLPFLLGAILIAWCWRGGVFWLAEAEQWNVVTRFVYTTQLPGMLDEFAWGMVLARLVYAQPEWFKADGSLFSKNRLFWVLLLAMIVVVTVTQKIYWQYSGYWDHPYMVIFWRTLQSGGFVLLLAVFIMLPAGGWTKNILYRTGHYLGDISYGIYLWHMPVIVLLKMAGVASPPLLLSATIGCTLLLSATSWHLLERPLIQKYRQPLWPRS